MASRNKQNVYPTSTFIPVRSADISLRDCFWLKCKQWRIYWVNQCNMPSDTHNNLQIHHRVFIAMNRARISMQMHVFMQAGYNSETLEILVLWLNDSKLSYVSRECLHILAFWRVKSCIMHILKIFRFNSIYLKFYIAYYVTFLVLVHILH